MELEQGLEKGVRPLLCRRHLIIVLWAIKRGQTAFTGSNSIPVSMCCLSNLRNSFACSLDPVLNSPTIGLLFVVTRNPSFFKVLVRT